MQKQNLSSEEGKYPGVYVLAYSADALEDRKINLENIFYVGMSNSLGGINQRLKQFLTGIEKNRCHSAAGRFFRDYANSVAYSILENRKTFYFAYVPIECRVEKAARTPQDLRMMGNVASLEYYVLAHIKEMLGEEPKLNKK